MLPPDEVVSVSIGTLLVVNAVGEASALLVSVLESSVDEDVLLVLVAVGVDEVDVVDLLK
jgi:hypothetical protein